MQRASTKSFEQNHAKIEKAFLNFGRNEATNGNGEKTVSDRLCMLNVGKSKCATTTTTTSIYTPAS